MKKLHEMSMGDLSVCIGKIARPAERLFGDAAVIDALKEVRERMPEKATVEMAMSLFVTILFPVLTDKKHKKDCYAILEALSDSEEAVENRNGVEVMGEMFAVFMRDRDVETIFRPGLEVRSGKDAGDDVQVGSAAVG